MGDRDLYGILGVARDASPSALRSAFRALAKRHHPDRAGAGSAERFTEIRDAYETLSDPDARRTYDERRALRERHRAGSASSRGRGGEPEQRAVLHGEIVLTPEEARFGASLAVHLPVFAPCSNCRGTRRTGRFLCPTCRGRGRAQRSLAIRLVIPGGVSSGTVLDFPVPWSESGRGGVLLRARIWIRD